MVCLKFNSTIPIITSFFLLAISFVIHSKNCTFVVKCQPKEQDNIKSAHEEGLVMDSRRKHRKELPVLSFFYNSLAGNRTPETETKAKAKKSGSRAWGFRKPKIQNHQDINGIEDDAVVKKQVQAKVVVEARKSSSHVETNFASVASFLHVKVLAVDMPGYMQVHAFRSARRTYDSSDKFSSKHMAYSIKKEFDEKYGPAWHCIVGSGFGSYVTYSTGCFLYFSMEKIFILMFKTKVQRALD